MIQIQRLIALNDIFIEINEIVELNFGFKWFKMVLKE